MPIKTSSPNPSPARPVEADDDYLTEIQSPADILMPEVLSGRMLEKQLMKELDLEELARIIRETSDRVQQATEDILCVMTLAVINAWSCGCALIEAKQKVGHGRFETWFRDQYEKNSGERSFCLRTAQRYMRLARNFPDLQKLVHSQPSLRQAYQACGFLPSPPENEKPVPGDGDAKVRAGLIKSVTSVQAKLRRFAGQKIPLDDNTRKELLEAKAEIDRLIESLVG